MMELINKENLKANILKMLSISGEEYLLPAERAIWNVINAEPTQEIIHCKYCKHWNPQFKTANGNGLGSCDFHNVALVTSEGFCYWADRRGEAE